MGATWHIEARPATWAFPVLLRQRAVGGEDLRGGRWLRRHQAFPSATARTGGRANRKTAARRREESTAARIEPIVESAGPSPQPGLTKTRQMSGLADRHLHPPLKRWLRYRRLYAQGCRGVHQHC